MQIPRLYKYREFIETETIRIGSPNREKIPRWQQVLYDGVLFLSPPDSFNDPYDCDFVVDSSFLNEPAAREICYESLLQMQTLSDEEKQEIHKNKQKIINTRSLLDALETALHAEVSTDIEAMLMRIVNESFQEIKREFRVLCFSELNDSMLMWSHYSHNHAGFCIEYKFQNIVNATIEGIANFLNTIKRNVIVTLDASNNIGTKACFLHQLGISHALVNQQVK